MEIPLAPANESLIQFLQLGSTMVNRKELAQKPITSIPPYSESIMKDLKLETITLKTNNPKKLSEFYTTTLGMQEIFNNQTTIHLGRNNKTIIELEQSNNKEPYNPKAQGLFHFGLLFENYASLVSTLLRVAYYSPNSYHSSSDHMITKSFYISDPDGNGIELYADTPKETWKWMNGKINIMPQKLNQKNFIQQYFDENTDNNWEDQPLSIGHIHLQTSNTKQSRKFYHDALNLDITLDLPSVTFYSAGGYHHLFAINTWNTVGIAETASNGLSAVKLSVAHEETLRALEQNLNSLQEPYIISSQDSLMVFDPIGIELAFSVRE